MKTKRSLSKKLFTTYAGWFLLCLVILVVTAVWYVGAAISVNIEETQERLKMSIDENVENYFEEMNAFSIDLLNSADFKENAIKALPEAYESGKGTSDLFSALYLDAYKMIQKKYSVGVLVDNRYYIWMGGNYYIAPVRDKDINTYESMERDEKPYLKYLDKNEYLSDTAGSQFKKEKEKSYITLSRSMDTQRKFKDGRAVLEIQVDAEDFRDSMKALSGNGTGRGLLVNVYDSEGRAVYEERDMDLSEYTELGKTGIYRSRGMNIDVRSLFDGRIKVVYTIDRIVYYEKLISFVLIALMVLVFVCGIIMGITYKISKQISRPINEMCTNVRKIDLEKGKCYEDVETDIVELEFLSSSLRRMNEQLELSLSRIITLKDYEIHAKMLALQAQMQPHFLFNTLATMGEMAEEEGNRSVAAMCMNLTQMFRYIAAEDSRGVRMFEEIRHIERYVEIMKERFPAARVDIDIPFEEMDCLIPKLTIQPLVENAFKYCNRKKPEIFVRGTISEDGRWTVEVEDNGSGFSAEKTAEIMEKCRESLVEEKTLSNKIDGMGLVNVYVRLKLFYGDAIVYRIEEGTSRIVIGGIKNDLPERE